MFNCLIYFRYTLRRVIKLLVHRGCFYSISIIFSVNIIFLLLSVLPEEPNWDEGGTQLSDMTLSATLSRTTIPYMSLTEVKMVVDYYCNTVNVGNGRINL